MRFRRSLALSAAVALVLSAVLVGSGGLAKVREGVVVAGSGAAAFVPLWLGSSVARAAMYQRLLPKPLGLLSLVPLMWVRALVVDLLPARVGLGAIPLILRWRWGLSLAHGVGTVAGVTVAEVGALGFLVLLACALTNPGASPRMEGFLVALGLGLLATVPGAIWTARTLGSEAGRPGVLGALGRAAQTVATLRRRGQLAWVMGWSLCTRVAKYGGLYVLVTRMPGVRMGVLEFLVSAMVAEATSLLPVQGLAGVGTWEAAWVVSARALGVGHDEAVRCAFGVHLFVLGVEITMGAVGVAALGIGAGMRWVRAGWPQEGVGSPGEIHGERRRDGAEG